MKQILYPADVDFIHFIYNPVAGQQNNALRAEQYETSLKEIFPNAKIIKQPTKFSGHATQLAKELVSHVKESQKQPRVVMVVAGGDGTVSETANGLIGSNIPLMVLPGGTGNDLTRSLYQRDNEAGYSGGVSEILKDFIDTKENGIMIFAVDAIKLQSPRAIGASGKHYENFQLYSANILSVGFDSMVAATAQKLHRNLPWVGALSYVLSAIRHLTKIATFKMRFIAGAKGENRYNGEVDYTICVMSNARFYGGGFQPNPHGNLNDGLIDVLLVKPLSRWNVVNLIGKFRKGMTIPQQYADAFQADRLHLSADSESQLIFNVDGEVYQAKELTVQLEEKVLFFLIPVFSTGNASV